MCDMASYQMVEEIIQEKVRAGEMFTAFDVSREARLRGSPERHRDLRPVIHALYGQGDFTGYTRTLVRIPGAPRSAFLYHHTSDDPNRYPPLGGAPAGGRGRPVDRRQRICVPVRSLRQVGLQPGDSVSVTASAQDNSLLLMKTTPSARKKTALSIYTIERNGNVRITQTVLRKAGMGGNAFDIQADGTHVKVRPA